MKGKKLQCKRCGEVFVPVNTKQVFCNRDCFESEYKEKEKESSPALFACEYCGKRTELTFDPKKDLAKWTLFKCPFCDKGRY
jgi:hypothetical protein